MTDLTPTLNTLLATHKAPPIPPSPPPRPLDSFLQEAYSIHARIADLTRTLRSTRPAYLSTAPPSRRKPASHQNPHAQPLTPAERDAFDASSKNLLRSLNAAIAALRQAEDVRNQTLESVAASKRAKSGLGALGRWAAGGAAAARSPEEEAEEGRRKALAAFRGAVVMFLESRLGDAGRVQAEMMEVRVGREVEKSKSVLWKSRGGGRIPYADGEEGMGEGMGGKREAAAEEQEKDTAELTQDQLQMFESENADLLQYYEGQMEQISQAERSILEISELHGTLHANLAQQSEHIEQLVQESYDTTENLGKGNKELKRASERRSTAQAVFWSTVGFCSFLVVWDLVF